MRCCSLLCLIESTSLLDTTIVCGLQTHLLTNLLGNVLGLRSDRSAK